MSKCLLGDVAESQTGPFGSQLHESDYVKQGTPIVTVEHLGDIGFTTQNLPFVSEKDTERLAKFLLEEGDIVFSRVGSIDRSVYVKKEQAGWMFSGRCLRVRCDKTKINPRFLSYYFKLAEFKNMMLNISVGATMPSLNTKLMDNIPLNVLERRIQDKIADLLDAIDSKIENNNRINAELESMAKTIYDYWFLQFEFPNEEGKPYKSSGGTMVWNEKLKREIPEGWRIEKLETVLKKIPKTKRYLTSEYKKLGKYPIIDQSKKYICGYTDEEEGVITCGSAIVFGDHTKEIKYVNFPFARGADGTQILVSADKALSNYLLFLQIQQMDLVNQGYSRYFKFLKDKNVFIPSKTLNDKFMSSVFDATFKIRESLIENQELISLRDFLLPLLMNGQVGFKE